MKKTLTMSLAALGIAGMVGGGTFATWSDYSSEDTSAGAGRLVLEVSSREGSTIDIDPVNLAPGESKFQEFWLASSDGESVPNADLKLTMTLNDIEGDGPSGSLGRTDLCTSNSELDDEGGSTCGTVGEFSSEASAQVLSSVPAATPASCPNTGIYSTPSGGGSKVLSAYHNAPVTLGTVTPGQGVCVRVEIKLPPGASDIVQGDSTAITYRFDLDQV